MMKHSADTGLLNAGIWWETGSCHPGNVLCLCFFTQRGYGYRCLRQLALSVSQYKCQHIPPIKSIECIDPSNLLRTDNMLILFQCLFAEKENSFLLQVFSPRRCQSKVRLAMRHTWIMIYFGQCWDTPRPQHSNMAWALLVPL